jgi:shikimate kinase
LKIYLIGMPGAGKSTLGRQLADTLMLPFVDLDKEIEKSENASIEEIFTDNGEEHFRLVEATSVRTISNTWHSFVMATGGGAPCFHDSIALMKEAGIVLFLDVDVETLHQRVKKSTHRPLLLVETDQELRSRLETLRAKRLPFYSQAHLSFTGATLSAQAVAQALLQFKKENQR